MCGFRLTCHHTRACVCVPAYASARQAAVSHHSTAVTHEVHRADGWGFSQMGGGDGVGPGPNALKSQVIGFLFAAAYMRGASSCRIHYPAAPRRLAPCSASWPEMTIYLVSAVPLIALNVITIFVKLLFG